MESLHRIVRLNITGPRVSHSSKKSGEYRAILEIPYLSVEELFKNSCLVDRCTRCDPHFIESKLDLDCGSLTIRARPFATDDSKSIKEQKTKISICESDIHCSQPDEKIFKMVLEYIQETC